MPNQTAVVPPPALEPGRLLRRIRDLLHRRYVRALVAALSLVVIAAGFGASALEIRHDVSHRAVVRFFARDHLGEADLDKRIRNHETVAQLVAISRSDLRVNPGGLVYAREGFLEFHPHVTARARASRASQAENEELFARLAPLYFNADVEALLRELDTPPVAARLLREGRDPGEIAHLRRSLRRAATRSSRHALLRRAAGYVIFFLPYLREPYELTFAETLRFYDRQDPQGKFVGTWEVHGIGPGGAVDEPRAFALGARRHYLSIFRSMDNSLFLIDYFRGRKRTYSILPIEHPSGATLYKVREA